SPEALRYALVEAVRLVQHPASRRRVVRRALRSANDWGHRAPQYIAVFQYVAGVLDRKAPYAFLSRTRRLVEALRVGNDRPVAAADGKSR
ncbi:MAG: hypothetical protein KDD44_11250, partial [Bdellovibrionales bacterium]|nr:hypothetical protein [Bdellovibrionales bacterium]